MGRSRWALTLFSLLAIGGAAPAQAENPTLPTLPTKGALDNADEQAEQYLQSLGLSRLLAKHLERKIASAQGARRLEIADRLAEVYAQILSETDDPAEQDRVEAAARALLDSIPQADSLELRLGLARAAYTRLEQSAEKRRIRALPEADAGALARRFDDVAARFEDIATTANARVQELERQETAAKSDENLIATALAGVRRQRSLAHYLAAWSRYYAAETDPKGREQAAVRAMRHLSWVLGAERAGFEAPKPEQVRGELLQYEHVARAALGMAVCRSLNNEPDEALKWLDLVEGTSPLAPGVREQMFARRASILARAQRWSGVREMVEVRRRDPVDRPGLEPVPVPLPPLEARLIAVLAIEAPAPNEVSRGLIVTALSDLLSRNEPGHLLELASAYGVERLASTGFVGHQVRALQLYAQAREAHAQENGAREPMKGEEGVRKYKEAAAQFRLALDAPDRASFSATVGTTRMLLGLCWFGAGGESGGAGASNLAQAAEWFEAASQAFTDTPRRLDAMWMGIRALDLHLASAGAPVQGAAARRDELIERYLKEAPPGERTTSLLLRRAQARAKPSEAEVQRLLAVSAEDPQFLASRRQAARMAYLLFRAAPPGAARESAGLRYVSIAEPLTAMERRRAETDPVSAQNAAAHARQVLDVLLSSSVPDAERAERALDVIAALSGARLIDEAPFASELALRRLQIAIARGRFDAAEPLIAEVSSRDPSMGVTARRIVFAARFQAVRRLRAAAPEQAASEARAALDLAKALIKAEPEAERATTAASLTLHAAAAECAALLWTSAADAEARDLALAVYRVLVRKQPGVRAYVRAVGELAEGAKAWDEARESWSVIAAGSATGSPDWFEARARTARALANTDPARALDLLLQHRALYPDFGPEPWGGIMRDLESELSKRAPKDGVGMNGGGA